MSQLGDIEAGRAIAGRLKSGSRPTCEAFCPDCGKSIAAVVAHKGSLWLYGPGGRVGSNRVLVAELEDEVREVEGDDTLAAAEIREAFSRFAQTARRTAEGAMTPPAAEELSDTAFRFGPLTATVACRGCRCWREVTLTSDLRLVVGERVPM